MFYHQNSLKQLASARSKPHKGIVSSFCFELYCKCHTNRYSVLFAFSMNGKLSSTMNAHETLCGVFGFDPSKVSQEMCKELFREYLTFHLQSSGAAKRFLDSVHRFERDCRNVCSSNQLSVTDEEIQMLRDFLNVLIDFNKQISNFLSRTFGCANFDSSQIPKLLWREMQTCLACVVLPVDIDGRLSPLLEVYLRLELELAEAENVSCHVFTSILPEKFEDSKRKIVHIARTQSRADQPLVLTRFFAPICADFASKALRSRVSALCEDNYSEHFLDAILDYKEKIMKKTWLRNIFTYNAKLLAVIGQKISDSLVYEVYYKIRKKDLFSLIIEYPDSIAALMDLGKCVEHIPVRQELIENLTEEVCSPNRTMHYSFTLWSSMRNHSGFFTIRHILAFFREGQL